MSKKIVIGLLVTVVAVTLLISSIASAQENDTTLEALYEQIYELRREVVERRVELGELSPEEGDERLELMEDRFQERKEEGFAPFKGMRNRGWGHGHRSGGYGYCH